MRRRSFTRTTSGLLGALALGLALGAVSPPQAARAQSSHVLIVVGIGGEDRYRDRFHEWAVTLRDGLVEGHGVPAERVIYLGEDPEVDPERIAGPSRRENVEAAIADAARAPGPDDRFMLVFFGHGTGSGEQTTINLPGPDFGGAELAVMLDAFPTQQVAVVNTASASGPFVQALSGPRRTIITATRTAQERNETWFGRYFAGAFASEEADLDRDGTVSLLEAYEYARREVARYYQEQGLIMTEHAMVDDDGDGRGSLEPNLEDGDGRLARAFLPGRAMGGIPAEVTDPVLRGLLEERAVLQRQLEALQARRADMDPEVYEQELEKLLIELALKDREIRARGGPET